MVVFLIVSAVSFLLITASVLFFPTVKIGKVKIAVYGVVAVVAAAALTAVGGVPFSSVTAGLTAEGEMNPLKILTLFFSMTFLSVYLDDAGFFRLLAGKAAKRAKNSPIKVFVLFYFLAAVLTVFTSNDMVILTLTPFICSYCKHTKENPVPYLLGEFVAANTWSMMLVIGNPTNVYLAAAANIGFMDYIRVMALPTLAAGAVEFLLVTALFCRKGLKKPPVTVLFFEEVADRPRVILGLIHLALCLVFLVISDAIRLPMWLIAAGFAGSLFLSSVVLFLITKKREYLPFASLKKLPWQLVYFVLAMFVIVIALNVKGVSDAAGAFLGERAAVWTYGGSSILIANVINNIPMSILFSTFPAGLSGAAYLQAIYATVIGSNIGAFLTPVGALAGIMFTSLTERYEVKYGFKEFIINGFLIGLPTAAAALGVLSLLI